MTPSDREIITPRAADPREILGTHETFLLYGDAGTGKTFLAGTAPEPQWWLTPGGPNELKTLFSPRFIKKQGRKEVFISHVKEQREKGQMSDNPSGYDLCCDAVDDFLEWNDREGMGVKTIIIDNATVLEEYMMNKAIMAEYVLASSKDKTVLRAEREFGIRKPHDSTYGGAQSFMDRWVNWLKELPFHLVFIAHAHYEWESSEARGNRTLRACLPLFVGKQRIEVPAKFDNVWRCLTQGGGRSQTWGIQSERDEVHLARTRVGGILDPSYERDVNLSDVIEQFADHARSLIQEDEG